VERQPARAAGRNMAQAFPQVHTYRSYQELVYYLREEITLTKMQKYAKIGQCPFYTTVLVQNRAGVHSGRGCSGFFNSAVILLN
jgi:aerobic-type carbon monoxide dehydrogenase small subunit (CoxS/CutS family)